MDPQIIAAIIGAIGAIAAALVAVNWSQKRKENKKEYPQVAPHVKSRILKGTISTPDCKVIFDLSFRQDEWFGKPTINAGYSSLAERLHSKVGQYAGGYDDPSVLKDVRVLLLPTPYGNKVEGQQYKNIIDWVYQGGGLMMMGIYLMEGHHYNNLNSLARSLGVEFKKNLVMPVDKEDFQSCMQQSFAFDEPAYWVVSSPSYTPKSHVITNGVSKIGFTSSCTLECVTEPEFSISTSERLAIMEAKGRQNPEGRLVQLTDYVPIKNDNAKYFVAFRYGAGRVIAVGSWKIWLNVFMQNTEFHNRILFDNTISWLSMGKI
ncbi:MAG: hypothetical protein H6696_14745 [Deferribacteres bacterium]|nr:hypothetical protein [candidate division KSB1 bacterium]MCB9503186.1 hypothetical protein [Deferribacteres bacterium]